MTTAILLGSSRSNGNTAKLSRHISQWLEAEIFDLNEYKIAPYDYEYTNRNDDFLPLVDRLLQFDEIIFASPMYWYSASGQMKIFLDRISDLLDEYKDKGRQLRTKKTALLATGHDLTPPECFEAMFSKTFRYLGMDYKGMLYCGGEENLKIAKHKAAIAEFLDA